ncbi:MAG: Gfo/Idh/MocA family oxidoreductase [Firmicutes bacterium]|nr:Gfo/Idh/MocA family oxidoreductase [Bacillota bacterium]
MKIGICGTGTVASRISDTIVQMNDPEITLYTCATSPGFDCREFAEKYGYAKISDSFDELMRDPEVDLVYIAVPNHLHYRMCMQAIACGKNLVCEKPFSVRVSECREVLAAAKEKHLFVSEALWPRFLPAYQRIQEEIAAGRIGELVSGEIVMLDNVMFLERVKSLATGGGATLDGGPYIYGAMTAFFGTDIAGVESHVRKLDTGVDAEVNAVITYHSGVQVTVRQTLDIPREQHDEYVKIVGTKGSIRMDAVSNPREVVICDEAGNPVKTLDIPPQIRFRGMPPVSGYEYEWCAFAQALREGKTECSEAPQAATEAISRVMSQILDGAGISFPF